MNKLTSQQQVIIDQTREFVKQQLSEAEGGHDWFHIYRVWKTAIKLAKEEQADLFIVNLGALLHDIADAKFHDGNEEIGPQKAEAFLKSLLVEQQVIDHIIHIIRFISFKNRNQNPGSESRELQVIRDADRIDAIGAIGIARAFNYGGYKGRALYDPSIKPNLNKKKEEYKAATEPTINHFYEKLLLLKDMMHTDSAKKMAQQRHQFMEQYLEQFYAEWEGKR
ncbi:MAG: HD domain-containing protein [Bacteroidales bacterium]|nr:HD domain-containing protein [Bacteroidales bacterium]